MPYLLTSSFLHGKTYKHKLKKVASEMATSPATRIVILSDILFESLEIYAEGGVTVGKLCQEVESFCAEPAPENEVQALRASDREGYWYWIKEGHCDEYTRLGWHRWNHPSYLLFKGFRHAEVCDDGAVRMEAHIS